MAAGGSRGAALGRAPRSAHVMAGGGGASPPMHRRAPAGRRAPSTAGDPHPHPLTHPESRRRRLPAPGPPPAGGDGEPRGAGKGRRRAGREGAALAVGRERTGRRGGERGPVRCGGCRCGRWLRQAHPAAHRGGGSAGPAPPSRRKRSPGVSPANRSPRGLVPAHAQPAAARRRPPCWRRARCLTRRGGAGKVHARR